MEKCLMDFALNPAVGEAVIRHISDFGYEKFKRLIDTAKDYIGKNFVAIHIADDWGMQDGLLMSPAQFKEFIYPAMKKLYKNWHSYGLYVIKHSDGDLNQIMDLLVDTGIDCLHSIDPMANMSLKKIKKEYGQRICIMGNVNCAGNLVHGTEEDVIDEVKRCISTAAPGGGYILSSSNSIPKSVKPENYIAMIKAVKEFGQYEVRGIDVVN